MYIYICIYIYMYVRNSSMWLIQGISVIKLTLVEQITISQVNTGIEAAGKTAAWVIPGTVIPRIQHAPHR